MKLTNITPSELSCAVCTCPAVYESDNGTYVIIGRKLSTEEINLYMKGKVGQNEEAVEISKDFFKKILGDLHPNQ